MGTEEIRNRQDATIAQHAYLNDLYNQLDVPYSQRQKPKTVGEGSVLLDELKRQVYDVLPKITELEARLADYE